MYCSKCGKEIKEGQNFCSECGTEVQETSNYLGVSGKFKLTNRSLIILICITLVIMVSMVGVLIGINLKNGGADKQTIVAEESSSSGKTESGKAESGKTEAAAPEEKLAEPAFLTGDDARDSKIRLKKTISTLNQVALMAVAQYDEDYSTIIGQSNSCTGSEGIPQQSSICSILNSSLSGHKVISNPYSKSFTVGGQPINTYVSLADGTIIGLNSNMNGCRVSSSERTSDGKIQSFKGAKNNYCLGFVDINGPKPPNSETALKGHSSTLKNGNVDLHNDLDSAQNYMRTDSSATLQVRDIYPIVFVDSSAYPATSVGRNALNN